MKKFQRQLLGLSQLSLLLCLLSSGLAFADTPQVSSPTHTVDLNAKDEALINQLVTAGIQPLYRELGQASQQLTQSSETFCKTTTLDNLQKLREAWGTTLLAWQRTDALLFGPATAEQMDFHINFFPPKKQIIKSLLDSTIPLTTASLAEAGVGAQGLSTLEYLLFDRELSTEQVLTTFSANQGLMRCSYLQAASHLLEENIKKITTPWLKGEATQQFASNQQVIDLLIGKAYQTLARINLKKLSLPLGLNDEKHQSHPYELEAWRSGYAFKIIQANAEGIRRVFKEGGFLAWIDQSFPNEATKIAVASFEKQLQELAAMQLPADDPFTLVEQNAEFPARTELVGRCRSLEMSLKRQLAVITKAQLGFNDSDGD